MTACAAILGMLPLALALGKGSETQAPLATAVIGGLFTSTVLTLFIVPVVYTMFDDLQRILTPHSHAAAHGEHPPSRGRLEGAAIGGGFWFSLALVSLRSWHDFQIAFGYYRELKQ